MTSLSFIYFFKGVQRVGFYLSFAALSFFFIISLSGCSEHKSSQPDIIVTLKPVHSLILALTQSTPLSVALLGGSNSPHNYALKPSDMKQLSRAKMIVHISPNMERFLVKPLATLTKKHLILTLAKIKGLDLLSFKQAHNHDDDHRTNESSTQHDTPENKKNNETLKFPDLHIWLNPVNMIKVTEHLKQHLIKHFPDHSILIKQNARQLKDQLIALDQDIKALIAPVRTQKFMVYHNAFQYFENRYGLQNVGSITLTSHTLPGSRHVVEIKNRIKKESIICLFTQEGKQPPLVKVLTENSEIKIMPLSALGISLKPSAGLYFEMMHKLAQDYKSCLARS